MKFQDNLILCSVFAEVYIRFILSSASDFHIFSMSSETLTYSFVTGELNKADAGFCSVILIITYSVFCHAALFPILDPQLMGGLIY